MTEFELTSKEEKRLDDLMDKQSLNAYESHQIIKAERGYALTSEAVSKALPFVVERPTVEDGRAAADFNAEGYIDAVNALAKHRDVTFDQAAAIYQAKRELRRR